eukprot:2928660-Rhodomonas_salina.2
MHVVQVKFLIAEGIKEVVLCLKVSLQQHLLPVVLVRLGVLLCSLTQLDVLRMLVHARALTQSAHLAVELAECLQEAYGKTSGACTT